MAKKVSLLQFLMRTGKFANAYKAEQAIRSHRIKVSNAVITNPKHFLNPKTALIFYDNQRLIPIKKLYFLFNKPKDMICQKSKEEQSIYDALKSLPLTQEQQSSLFAIGRLDKDTEGLLIITNDGTLSDTLMRPESKITKTYEATLNLPLHHAQAQQLEKGITLITEDGNYTTKPCSIKKKTDRIIEITLTEGKKRQVRKMLETIGNEVLQLKRIAIGSLQLGSLQPQEIRKISKEDLLKSLGLSSDSQADEESVKTR